MESQESDICNAEDMDLLLREPEINRLMESVQDWSEVAVPDLNQNNPTGELPARTEYPGIHLFDAKVDMTGNHRKNYYVSTKLNKVFLDMDKVLPVQIKWDGQAGLYVRALMMFTLADQMKQPVKRCLVHRDPDNPTNYRYDHLDHVLASENENARYEVDQTSHRHSVIVPLHLQQGCDHALINYKFMCKTSCSGGLNRAPTDVIFTLEDAAGMVLGRQKLGVKICSCPKRDKEKDEENVEDPSNKSKKVKMRKEDKASKLEPSAKRIKTEYNFSDNDPLCSFMVTAKSPHIAELLKDYLRKWDQIKSIELAEPGPLLSIIEDVAVMPPPYS